jgi:hypothetical protein
MRVGIVTLHEAINHGAFMQVWSLFEAIRRQGLQVEVVDYVPPVMAIKKWMYPLRAEQPAAYRDVCQALRRAQAEHLSLSKRCYTGKAVSRMGYDLLVFGSDEIWSLHNPALQFVRHQGLGYDPVFFGAGVEAGRKIAYAGSFGSTRLDEVLPQVALYGLQSLDRVTVRDQNSAGIISKAVRLSPPIVPDPTFLLDPPEVDAPEESIGQVLVYATNVPTALRAEVQGFASRRGLRTVSLVYPHAWCDDSLTSLSPFEWYAAFKHARCVVTHMFHGCIMSIKTGTPYCWIPDPFRLNKFSEIRQRFNMDHRQWRPGALEGSLVAPERSENEVLSELRVLGNAQLRELLPVPDQSTASHSCGALNRIAPE